MAAIGGQIGAALDAAHAVGLVHRDVKPANVLLSGEHAYLADFGLSQVVGSDTRLTSTGQWIGTVDFMAPEQFSGAEVDARADVYALGCVLYNALTGEVPYPRGTVPATMLAHMQDTPPRPTAVAADVPAGFDRVIARALAKEPERRYPSAGDLGRAALAAAEGRHVTEVERTVARGAAAPPERAVERARAHRGDASWTRRRSSAPRPRATGRCSSRARRCRSATGRGAGVAAARPRCCSGLLALGAAGAAVAVLAGPGGGDPGGARRARPSTRARSRRWRATSPRPTARRTRTRSAGC